ncbi:hypothetical protein HAX54_045091, partial [Datura stramonium]|nr:hypothetical protein [Datura stramonium]
DWGWEEQGLAIRWYFGWCCDKEGDRKSGLLCFVGVMVAAGIVVVWFFAGIDEVAAASAFLWFIGWTGCHRWRERDCRRWRGSFWLVGYGGMVVSSVRKAEVRGKGAAGTALRCSSELMEVHRSSDFNGFVEKKGKSRGRSGGCRSLFFSGLLEKIIKRRGMGVGDCYR